MNQMVVVEAASLADVVGVIASLIVVRSIKVGKKVAIIVVVIITVVTIVDTAEIVTTIVAAVPIEVQQICKYKVGVTYVLYVHVLNSYL